MNTFLDNPNEGRLVASLRGIGASYPQNGRK